MGKLSIEKKSRIKESLKAGQSVYDVASKFGISKSTVHRMGRTINSNVMKSKGGRLIKLSPQTKRTIVRMMASGKHKTAVSIRDQLELDYKISVS
ncbi:hypothetical protein BB559_005405 [Furculomyces boomerangus]|uniref:Uncharacterized protein n=2 Tax=Harpellales TaxID=61421 RepID=A0A2T9Y8W7_9FUNG|nr:hypothetical protein BB559_005405 [Furculomyces boomerangus]PVZ98006.1 hypothetical protein BB558_006004 [Smittium angustum]